MRVYVLLPDVNPWPTTQPDSQNRPTHTSLRPTSPLWYIFRAYLVTSERPRAAEHPRSYQTHHFFACFVRLKDLPHSSTRPHTGHILHQIHITPYMSRPIIPPDPPHCSPHAHTSFPGTNTPTPTHPALLTADGVAGNTYLSTVANCILRQSHIGLQKLTPVHSRCPHVRAHFTPTQATTSPDDCPSKG